MSDYRTIDTETGEFVHVYDLEKCLTSIRIRNKQNEEQIQNLREENRKLKEEYSKEEELQKMKKELDKMRKDCYRGFPITEEEQNAIRKWQETHDKEVHGLDTPEKKIAAGGTIGGRYHYVFLPTSIGTCGKVVCSCGAEFQFQEMV